MNINFKELLTIIKGFRNGIVYGAKIRFPHALVMTFLFRYGDVLSKLRWILTATKQHSLNLGMFVAIFKSIMLLLKKVNYIPLQWHSLIAGFIGGYLIFGDNDPINNQVNNNI